MARVRKSRLLSFCFLSAVYFFCFTSPALGVARSPFASTVVDAGRTIDDRHPIHRKFHAKKFWRETEKLLFADARILEEELEEEEEEEEEEEKEKEMEKEREEKEIRMREKLRKERKEERKEVRKEERKEHRKEKRQRKIHEFQDDDFVVLQADEGRLGTRIGTHFVKEASEARKVKDGEGEAEEDERKRGLGVEIGKRGEGRLGNERDQRAESGIESRTNEQKEKGIGEKSRNYEGGGGREDARSGGSGRIELREDEKEKEKAKERVNKREKKANDNVNGLSRLDESEDEVSTRVDIPEEKEKKNRYESVRSGKTEASKDTNDDMDTGRGREGDGGEVEGGEEDSGKDGGRDREGEREERRWKEGRGRRRGERRDGAGGDGGKEKEERTEENEEGKKLTSGTQMAKMRNEEVKLSKNRFRKS